jgi:hypothetical protein
VQFSSNLSGEVGDGGFFVAGMIVNNFIFGSKKKGVDLGNDIEGIHNVV